MEPLFLKPVFQERIWGGTKLREQFNYDIPSEKTGECWAISAHTNGPSTIENGKYRGKTLEQLWREEPTLFGNEDGSKGTNFPLLTKILDANDDLSVQVHPDDSYANTYENGGLGKTECWYIIDCEQGAEMIYGHNAKSKQELITMVENGEWSALLRRVKIRPGDFFYVPSGTIHALCKGTLVLETQQSSDTTYRVYDYDRIDDEGHKRQLHLEQAIEVSNTPHYNVDLNRSTIKEGSLAVTTFIRSDFFSVYKWHISGQAQFPAHDTYLLCSVINGHSTLIHGSQEYKLIIGSHFILPVGFADFTIIGECEIIVSHV